MHAIHGHMHFPSIQHALPGVGAAHTLVPIQGRKKWPKDKDLEGRGTGHQVTGFSYNLGVLSLRPRLCCQNRKSEHSCQPPAWVPTPFLTWPGTRPSGAHPPEAAKAGVVRRPGGPPVPGEQGSPASHSRLSPSEGQQWLYMPRKRKSQHHIGSQATQALLWDKPPPQAVSTSLNILLPGARTHPILEENHTEG